MRIAMFAGHSYYGGLGNTGGSRTIVRSAAALRTLGHDVDIVAGNDRYTWDDHPRVRRHIPKTADVVCAVSISDLSELIQKEPSCKLAYWMRGWEIWQMPPRQIFKTLRKLRKREGIILCNSGWLVRCLATQSIISHLCHSGIDLHELHDDHLRDERLTIGCLRPNNGRHTTLHATKGWYTCWRIHESLGDRYRWLAYGAPKKCPHAWVNTYYPSPDAIQKRQLYSRCHIWLSPSTLEGFHNPPAEAALCGALIVCADVESGGTSDYATSDGAHRYTNIEDAIDAIRNPDFSRVARCQERLRAIGNRTRNMRRFVALLKGEEA